MTARGFTLIELVMVVLILSIAAIALWPRAPSRESVTLLGRAEQLAADIRYAQTLAMTTGLRHCLSFTPAPPGPYSGYTLMRAASSAPSGACVTAVPQAADLNLAGPIALCVGGPCVTAPALANGYVQFDGLGRPYSAPGTALVTAAVITLSEDGTRTVTVSPETGRVIVQ